MSGSPTIDSPGLAAVWLAYACKQATPTTVFLLLDGTPIAWWLVDARTRPKGVVSAVAALPERGITALFGPSCSGKTTILRCNGRAGRLRRGHGRNDVLAQLQPIGGGYLLLARITERSRQTPAITPLLTVIAQVKSGAILH